MIRFCSLASSSSGNAIFVDVDGYYMLIDAGINYKKLNQKLESVGKYLMDIDAIFITHAHGDHNCSVPLIVKNFPGIHIFSGENGNITHGEQIQPRTLNSPVVTPFMLSHDEPCHGFTVEDATGNKLAVIEDTGTIPCDSLRYLIDCHAIVVEMNHDTDMLVECNLYPTDLQERIFSDSGHLRNEQARSLLEMVAWPGLEVVVPYHLSANCNIPEIAAYEAYAGVQAKSPKCQVVCALKDNPTDFFTLL